MLSRAAPVLLRGLQPFGAIVSLSTSEDILCKCLHGLLACCQLKAYLLRFLQD
jgi:hypothetical protein